MPHGQALDAVFTIRLRKAERRRFEAIATAQGMGLSEWARKVLLGVAGRPPGEGGKMGTAGKG